ncbi:MmoB/DmpM family protein [Streptomyces silvisoli]|uniref:MmoB/DmpM family protein n=1 Tax=Streptomyces silvisoli TaxID=3034235 RepID=A0ABT5ZTU1_9ACTN|nr:MmoB/DmpM family protein [Streptomyces silvisoli]MDF3293236.1 MmoB/DmpM family protein [Streptomyces silvisoli]
MSRLVGPVLRMGDDVDQVIAAIEDDNPDQDIEVVDRGAYVRVRGARRVTVTLETLRRYLGPDFEIRSMETMMSSFVGRVITTSDSITWEDITARSKAAAEGAAA